MGEGVVGNEANAASGKGTSRHLEEHRLILYFTQIQNTNLFETALLTGNSGAEAASCSPKIFCVSQYNLENCSGKEYV